MACPDKLRLSGLVARYVGPRARWVAAVANVCGLWVGMVAYIIVGGEFLANLLRPFVGGEVFAYQIAWALGATAVIYFSLNVVTRLGFVTVSALILAFLLIFARSIPAVRGVNLVLFDIKDVFLPYGVLLFSLSGYPAILEMEDILEGKHERYRRAVLVGSLVGAFLTLAFGLVVFGVTGAATTEDAVTGLKAVLGGNIATLAALLGFLAIVNCYLRVGVYLRHTFQYDFKLRRPFAWLLATAVPVGVFLLGTKSFVSMISFSGAVFGGVTAIMIVLLYLAVARKEKLDQPPLRVPRSLAYVAIVILGAGAVYEVADSFAKLWRP